MIKCQQFDPVSDEKERSGSFGAYKSYQRMLEKANENDSPEPFGRVSTQGLGNDFSLAADNNLRMTSSGYHPFEGGLTRKTSHDPDQQYFYNNNGTNTQASNDSMSP